MVVVVVVISAIFSVTCLLYDSLMASSVIALASYDDVMVVVLVVMVEVVDGFISRGDGFGILSV